MEEQIIVTRSTLVDAFTAWHAGCAKNPDGTLAGQTPDNPVKQADLLLGYLRAI